MKNEKEAGIEKLSSICRKLGLASITVVTATTKKPNKKKLKLQPKAMPHIKTIGIAVIKKAKEPAKDFS